MIDEYIQDSSLLPCKQSAMSKTYHLPKRHTLTSIYLLKTHISLQANKHVSTLQTMIKVAWQDVTGSLELDMDVNHNHTLTAFMGCETC